MNTRLGKWHLRAESVAEPHASLELYTGKSSGTKIPIPFISLSRPHRASLSLHRVFHLHLF